MPKVKKVKASVKRPRIFTNLDVERPVDLALTRLNWRAHNAVVRRIQEQRSKPSVCVCKQLLDLVDGVIPLDKQLVVLEQARKILLSGVKQSITQASFCRYLNYVWNAVEKKPSSQVLLAIATILRHER